MKIFKITLLCVVFAVFNQWLDFYIDSRNIYYSFYMTMYMFVSPAFILRGTIFSIVRTYPCDWILDLTLMIALWYHPIKLINKYLKIV